MSDPIDKYDVSMREAMRALVSALPGCDFPPHARGEKCCAPATRMEWDIGNAMEHMYCDAHGALNPDAGELPYAGELRAAMALAEEDAQDEAKLGRASGGLG